MTVKKEDLILKKLEEISKEIIKEVTKINPPKKKDKNRVITIADIKEKNEKVAADKGNRERGFTKPIPPRTNPND